MKVVIIELTKSEVPVVLRHMRKQANLSQKALATATHCDDSTVSNHETGKRCSYRSLHTMLKFLFDADDLRLSLLPW